MKTEHVSNERPENPIFFGLIESEFQILCTEIQIRFNRCYPEKKFLFRKICHFNARQSKKDRKQKPRQLLVEKNYYLPNVTRIHSLSNDSTRWNRKFREVGYRVLVYFGWNDEPICERSKSWQEPTVKISENDIIIVYEKSEKVYQIYFSSFFLFTLEGRVLSQVSPIKIFASNTEPNHPPVHLRDTPYLLLLFFSMRVDLVESPMEIKQSQKGG